MRILDEGSVHWKREVFISFWFKVRSVLPVDTGLWNQCDDAMIWEFVGDKRIIDEAVHEIFDKYGWDD